MTFFQQKNYEKPVTEIPAQKRHWGRYLWTAFFILLTITIIAVYRFAQKPAEGIVKPANQQNIKAVEIGSSVPETFTGKYVTFMYENSYVLKSDELAEKSGDVILERAYLTESGAMSKKISLTVRDLPSRKLKDDPDYLMREINLKRYRKENFSQGSVQGVSFVPADDSQFEKTFFVLHNDLVATISITAPGTPDEKLNKEADIIAKSLTWNK